MLLTDREIREALELGKRLSDRSSDISMSDSPTAGWIRIDDLTEDQFGSCSIDLRLDKFFSIFKHARVPFIDVQHANPETFMQTVKVAKEKGFTLQAKEFVLGITQETVALADDILARLEGRSSLGRLGIIVHATAGVIDPGWYGKIVLELGNHNVMPVTIYPGMRICSLTFERLSAPVSMPYRKKPGRKYAGQRYPVGSLISRDHEISGIDNHQLALPGLFDMSEYDYVDAEEDGT